MSYNYNQQGYPHSQQQAAGMGYPQVPPQAFPGQYPTPTAVPAYPPVLGPGGVLPPIAPQPGPGQPQQVVNSVTVVQYIQVTKQESEDYEDEDEYDDDQDYSEESGDDGDNYEESEESTEDECEAENVYMQGYQEIPTIKASRRFDANADAKILRKAMKGLGTDENAIINVIGKRTNSQRQEIALAFKTMFGKDLLKNLKSELSGHFEDTILALMTPRGEYLARRLHKAIDGVGTREQTLIDILCTANAQEIREINAIYSKLFNRSLEKDLKGDTSGHFQRLLVSLNTAGRSDDLYGDEEMAEKDAKDLYKAGEKRVGTDESTFNMILSTRSFPQIRLICEEYQRITGHSLEKAIKKEFSGDIEAGLLAVVKSAQNRAAYFAERIHKSVAGLGTTDTDLIFIVVSRSEVDLENIKQEYNKMYNKPLAADISGDTSGDYKKILLTLIGEK